ncbi:MAG: hypothetical protein ACTSUC_09295 [Promethearchaeota archaeon]
MRKIIFLPDENNNKENYNEKIDLIVEKFVSYMETFQTKTSATGITTLLGPAGKIINKLKAEPDINLDSLIGYGARVHEMSTHYIDFASLELLSDATRELFKFIKNIPINIKDRIFGQVYFSLYFHLKKIAVSGRHKYLTRLSEDYIKWLENEYKDIETFNQKANTNYKEFSNVSLPTQRSIEKMKDNERKIAKKFLELWSYKKE